MTDTELLARAITFVIWNDEPSYDGTAPERLVPATRADYLAVAGPLFAELAEMAGISEGNTK